MRGMTESVLAAEQRATNHETATPARRRNMLEYDCLVAPNEAMSAFDHAAKEILVFTARSELAAKRRLRRIQEITTKKQISGTALVPWDHESGRMSGTLVKAALNKPSRRFAVEVGFNWTQDASNLIGFANTKKVQEPVRRRELIVVNEHNEVTCRMRKSPVTGQSDVALRLRGVGDNGLAFSPTLFHYRSGRLRRMIIHNHNRVLKGPACFLLRNLTKQSLQHGWTIASANADGDMRKHGWQRSEIR